MAKKKNYSLEERYKYHSDRDGNCGKYGLQFGSPKHMYSAGFTDAFWGRDNTAATRHEFGEKSARGYAAGRKVALTARKKFGRLPKNIFHVK